MVNYPEIDYQDITYYVAPGSTSDGPKSIDDVDPKLLETYDKLGIPLHERDRLLGVAVDAVFDSVSVGTTFKKELGEKGVIFCSFSEAVQEHPELVRKYLGSVVPQTDNFYAALNSAVFTDGSFCYIPKGVRCPMELRPIFASTRPSPASSSARSSSRMRAATSATSKAAPHQCVTRISSTQRSSNSSRWTMRRSNIRPCRTGIRAMKTA